LGSCCATGENNILWGTDCIFYGSPQDQIQAFRAFHISREFQERYGYPALTPARKAKILGLNGARVYGVKPRTVKCKFSRRELEEIRSDAPVSSPDVRATKRARGEAPPGLPPRVAGLTGTGSAAVGGPEGPWSAGPV
jgi:hypothetical protein